MFNRLLNPLKSNSFFLFGARGTGKTTCLKSLFPVADTHLWIDLLDPFEEDRLARHPKALWEQVEANPKLTWVILDEVQKLPKLLDLVHKIIEEKKIKFALTGSSARKLKRGAANMLAGRAFLNYLYPLTHVELEKFELNDLLNWGSLPKVVLTTSKEERREYLKTYAITYINEEIKAEQIVRKLDPFRKFLEIAAQNNGELLNYSNIARDVGVDTKTVQSYYQILEDTLLGFTLEPYHHSVRKQQSMAGKFYFFDLGVKKALEGSLRQELISGNYLYGKAFEAFVIMECYRLNQYYRCDFKFSHLRTKDGAEIDLIITRPGRKTVLIEIKSKPQTDERDIRHLVPFLKDMKNVEGYLLSLDPIPKKINGVKALPWQEGIKEIFSTTA